MLAPDTEVVDGRRLRVARTGNGPPLVLLHGYPDTLQIWSNLAAELAHRFEVIAFDWPGIGESEAWSGGATPYDLARRVVRLLDHLRLDRATIAGHDMGGQAALAVAVTEPSRVSAVVVMNSLVLWNERTSWEIALLRRFRINRFLLRHFPRLVFERAVQTSVGDLPREIRDDLWRNFHHRHSRDFIIRMCAGYEGTLPRLASQYSSIAAPLTIIWGARDHHFPLEHGQRLNGIVKNSTLHVIEGGDHWMVWNRAGEVALVILDTR